MAATTTHQVIDPSGDILLCFPGRDQQHQQQLQLPGPAPFGSHGADRSSPSMSPNTVCSELNRHPVPHDDNGNGLGNTNNPNTASPSSQNPSTVLLQVSSSVLCLASPVFSAMLSGPMAEGLAFRSPGSPRPFPLTLPDDSGEVFAILANILHFRAAGVPFLPSTTTLLALASLVDKYGCAGALTSHAEMWMNRALDPSRRDDPEFAPFSRRCELLLFAYALDLPGPFARLSWEVMLHHRQQLKGETEFGLDLPIPENHELLRHDLHGELAKRKARLRRELYAALMEPITRVTAYLTFPRNSPSPPSSQGRLPREQPVVPPTCPNAALAMGNYMAFLDAHNLCPWRPQYETDSFASIIARAIDAANRACGDSTLRFEMCSRSRCRCSAMAYGDGVHMAQKLAWTLAGAMQWKLFACLDCLKNGNDGQGTCRVKHC